MRNKLEDAHRRSPREIGIDHVCTRAVQAAEISLSGYGSLMTPSPNLMANLVLEGIDLVLQPLLRVCPLVLARYLLLGAGLGSLAQGNGHKRDWREECSRNGRLVPVFADVMQRPLAELDTAFGAALTNRQYFTFLNHWPSSRRYG